MKYAVKGTTRQRKAVENIVENGGVVSRAMVDAGYTEKTAKTPQKLTESKGFKELMKEYGLTEGLITKALVEDIKGKRKKRVRELELGADILGMRKREVQENKTLIINISGETAQKYGIKPKELP